MSLKYTDENRIARVVKIWLIAGLVMIFMQVVIGGITRLTGSGLSITRWEIVTGAVPPLNEAGWEAEFELYKQTPQYARINQGMTLGEFKFIYFWEYFHRLWARLMGLVFIFPFGWFLWRGMLSRRLMLRLLVVVALAGLEGFFGWIMVASGLIQRPWVNAYNLTLHLCMALVIFGYLLWTIFIAYQPRSPVFAQPALKRFAWTMVVVTFVQIALGALMSGSKAGLFYPTWPDMHGEFLPAVLLDGSHWTADSFIHYDTNPFMPALIQFLHRNTAYVLTIMVLYFAWQMLKTALTPDLRRGVWALVTALGVQVLLGIFTLINCIATVPVDLGVLHQAGAVVLFGVLLFVNYRMSGDRRIS
ncbi:MAG TPA: COX15/CtaA family protein [Saprospiraceae bacterium]|nr:COX15/CtaA family protein [Saprospiraceae bacterium]